MLDLIYLTCIAATFGMGYEEKGVCRFKNN